MKTIIEVDTEKQDVYLVDKGKDGFIWKLVEGFDMEDGYVVSPSPEPSSGKFGQVTKKRRKA